MSLTFDLTSIADYENLCYVERIAGKREMNPVTHGIIFATMIVGIGNIRDEHIAEEFYARLTIYERLQGAFCQEPDPNGGMRDVLITPEEVKQHIGLRTNVPHETRTKWVKRIITDERTGAIVTFIKHFRNMTKEAATR